MNWLNVLIISLAILFHGILNRYDFTRFDDSSGILVDNLTGGVSLCGNWSDAPPSCIKMSTATKFEELSVNKKEGNSNSEGWVEVPNPKNDFDPSTAKPMN